MRLYDLVVVGGGAAGFFAAIQAAEKNNKKSILILEKTHRLLSKVKISGGGRCNVTHHCFDSKKLSTHYPRGERVLRDLFKVYQPSQLVDWFKQKGVPLKAEPDGRMFPKTDDSQTIVNCFLSEAKRHRIEIQINQEVQDIEKKVDTLIVICKSGERYEAKNILIAIGGHPNPQSYSWLKTTGHTIKTPIASLFTFNDTNRHFSDLMGISVTNAYIKIEGSEFESKGALLITHWGLSGPTVIKLSAWSAEYLYKKNYSVIVLVSWIGEETDDWVRKALLSYKEKHPKQQINTHPLYNLPQRLWKKICDRAEIEETKTWGDSSKRNINKLIEEMLRSRFYIKGKTTFKEEFVTCGGIPLQEINTQTMQSRLLPNLFFAGEVLDIDGETGGFNFQAAWTTAYVAATAIAKK